MIVKEKDDFTVRIKDIVSAKLENSTSIRFNETKDYTETNENIDTVISFIVTLLAGQELKTSVSSTLAKLKTVYKNKKFNKKNEDIFTALYEIAKKYIHHKDKNQKIRIHTIIQDINRKLNRN